ncbi:hydrogenase formation protein [Betaproteobacteria bacterium]|nr:hydrogenase formation protein [Betaproteobacteria bacterium]GHU10185.1 hydrogenase formation protein [Betaproteobacteria bacterium]GHU17036.1 hydrogenase formation protein [Betaproteobacteria bacterium]
MCIGIPMQVIEDGLTHARCRDPRGAEVVIDLLLTGPQPQGAWLMTFLGAARAVLDEHEAQHSLAAVRALDTLLAGGTPDLDAAFADLVGRTPQLPDFLRPPR